MRYHFFCYRCGVMETSIKLAIVGDCEVGKTSLLDRFTENIFNEGQQKTKEEKWYTKNINEDVEVQILDTCFTFRNVKITKYRKKHGIIVVYDVNKQETFENAKKKWYVEAKRYSPDDMPIILIGNKIDIQDSRVVEYQTAKEFADEVNIEYFETSTKHDIGVEEAFYGLFRQISNNPVFSKDIPQIPSSNANSKCICF